jgi:hypothetical protein
MMQKMRAILSAAAVLLAWSALSLAPVQAQERRTIRLPWPAELPCAEPRSMAITHATGDVDARWVAESESDLRRGRLEMTATSSSARTEALVRLELTCESSGRSLTWSCTMEDCGVVASYGPAPWSFDPELDWRTRMVPAGIEKLAAGKRSEAKEGVAATALAYLGFSAGLLNRACPGQRCSREAEICRREIARLSKIAPRYWSLRRVVAAPVRIQRMSDEAPGGIAHLSIADSSKADVRMTCLYDPSLTCALTIRAPGCRWSYSVNWVYRTEDAELGDDGWIWESETRALTGDALRLIPASRLR